MQKKNRLKTSSEISVTPKIKPELKNTPNVTERLTAIHEKKEKLFNMLKKGFDKPFTMKDAAIMWQNFEGKNDVNKSFALNHVYSFDSSDRLKRVLGSSPIKFGFPEWFEMNGLLKSQYQ